MAIPPISRALSEDELRAYFEALLDEVSIPIFIQDASSYVGNPMSIGFQASLFETHGQRVLFKPESSPLGPCISALRAATNERAAIFEGSGGVLLIDSFRRGITGTIPGVELLDGTAALWKALQDGDEERAYQLYFPICALVTAITGLSRRFYRQRTPYYAQARALSQPSAPGPSELSPRRCNARGDRPTHGPIGKSTRQLNLAHEYVPSVPAHARRTTTRNSTCGRAH